MGSCSKEEVILEQNYIFQERYCAMVVVGGVVGITERCFEVGEVVVGYEKVPGIISIRIAAHSNLNDGPPQSWSYQEFVEVSLNYLELRKD
jgi:hypothetical protein